MNKLKEEFQRIKKNHKKADQHFFARAVLGSSVMRVFNKGSKEFLMNALIEIDIDKLKRIKTQEQFKDYFEKELNSIANVIKKCNYGNKKIQPGYKWGHSTKILCLFLRDIVLHSRYFPERIVDRLSKWLYIPIDSIVIKRLRKLGLKLPFQKIKEIDSREKFFDTQKTINNAAIAVGVPRVWFDDNWAQREN